MKTCEFCHGRGTLRMFPIPDLTKCFSLPAKDQNANPNNYHKICEDICPLRHGLGYISDNPVFVDNPDMGVVQ